MSSGKPEAGFLNWFLCLGTEKLAVAPRSVGANTPHRRELVPMHEKSGELNL
jgi:hypothetical protein